MKIVNETFASWLNQARTTNSFNGGQVTLGEFNDAAAHSISPNEWQTSMWADPSDGVKRDLARTVAAAWADFSPAAKVAYEKLSKSLGLPNIAEWTQ
jgi:hypothetical protein